MIHGLYGIPAGVDFPEALIAGLDAAYADQPPEALAKLTIVVNTDRMRRRLRALYDQGPARLLPRLITVVELADYATLPPARPGLTRRLELAHLIAKAAAQRPGFVEDAQRFALADSLAGLLDELEGEGIAPERLAQLDGPDLSEHWAETQAFIAIAAQYQRDLGGASGRLGRLRQALISTVDAPASAQQASPPLETALPSRNPVVLAGSTGSVGAVLELMVRLLGRDNAAVVLPGFDTTLSGDDWHAIAASPNWEDHPQSRFVGLARRLGWQSADLAQKVQPWSRTPSPKVAARAAVLSLALCPAPVSDQWRSQGPKLGDLEPAMADVTLLEAPNPRAEAMAIALRIRAAIEQDKRVALITPDRVLSRRVTAQLSRWDIVPDDSAGVPLGLTAMGRLARHVAALAKAPPDLSQVLAILKHPLCSPGPDRAAHQNATRRFELWTRQDERGLPGQEALTHWAARHGLQDWAAWLTSAVLQRLDPAPDLGGWVSQHRARIDALLLGASGQGLCQEKWSNDEGRAVATLFDALSEASDAAPEAAAMPNPRDYVAFFEQAMQGQELRRTGTTRSDVAIWGTLEARAQGVDLAILAGLTEGVWPALPPADPWLNRALRRAAGLAAPERRIGLQAHDFQQGALAPEIWLCRPLRDDEADTIAARWLMRLTGLLDGLPETGGRSALRAMRHRGNQWLALAERLEDPVSQPRATRPCPMPPADFRPRQISATDLERLRRDPYAVYAKRVLRLYPLNPLRPAPDAAARGILLHTVFERALQNGLPSEADRIIAHLARLAREVTEAETAWPAAQLIWQARINRMAPSFAALELNRPPLQSRHLERRGRIETASGVTLTARADRIDIDQLGRAWLFDYKTGSPPSPDQRRQFDPQMPVMGWMLRQGAFQPPGQRDVAGMAYLHLGHEVAEKPVDLAEAEQIADHLHRALCHMLDPETGFAARIMPKMMDAPGDYDHLARYGEWEITDPPLAERLE